MVRAILEGRKTQTRRVVKPQPVWVASPGVPFKTQDADPKGIIRCPHGAPGDRLWGKETWGMQRHGDVTDWFRDSLRGDDWLSDFWEVQYRAEWGPCQEGCFWRPSIYMPRWASRLTLEIEAVRVERLQEISEEDAMAEGWDPQWRANEIVDQYRPLLWYGSLWCDINGPASWDANPWVWVIQFRRIIEKGGAS